MPEGRRRGSAEIACGADGGVESASRSRGREPGARRRRRRPRLGGREPRHAFPADLLACARARCLGYEALLARARRGRARGRARRRSSRAPPMAARRAARLGVPRAAPAQLRDASIRATARSSSTCIPRPRCTTRAAAREFGDLIRYYGLLPKRVCVEILDGDCADERPAARGGGGLPRARRLASPWTTSAVGRSNFDRVVGAAPRRGEDRPLDPRRRGGRRRSARRMLPGMIELLHDAGAQVVGRRHRDARPRRCVAIDAGADYLQGFYFAAPGAEPRRRGVRHRGASADCCARARARPRVA